MRKICWNEMGRKSKDKEETKKQKKAPEPAVPSCLLRVELVSAAPLSYSLLTATDMSCFHHTNSICIYDLDEQKDITGELVHGAVCKVH